MADLMQVVKQRAEQHGVKNVVVPTKETGATVKRAQEVLGTDYRFFAVGNPFSSYDRKLCLHKGISDAKRRELESLGITVVVEDQSITQAWAMGGERRLINSKFLHLWGKDRERNVPLAALMENIRGTWSTRSGIRQRPSSLRTIPARARYVQNGYSRNDCTASPAPVIDLKISPSEWYHSWVASADWNLGSA